MMNKSNERVYFQFFTIIFYSLYFMYLFIRQYHIGIYNLIKINYLYICMYKYLDFKSTRHNQQTERLR